MFKSYAVAITLMVVLAVVGIAAARYGADAAGGIETPTELGQGVQRMTDVAPQRIDKPSLKEVVSKEPSVALGGKALRR